MAPPQERAPAQPVPAAQPAQAQSLNQELAGQYAALRDWQNYCDSPERWVNLPSSALRNFTDLRPNSAADVSALRALVDFASAFRRGRSALGPQLTREQVSDSLNQLFRVYTDQTPTVVQTSQITRMATTLRALLEAGLTPEKLKSACFWSKARDVGAQLTASTIAYLGGFYTLTASHLEMAQAKFQPQTREVAAPFVLIATSLLAARFLREAEMNPGWTRAVEADAKGNAVAAAQTSRGFWKIAAQFAPFLASLAYVDAQTRDPAHIADTQSSDFIDLFRERATERMSTGFIASELVGLYRMSVLDREHTWLDASTPEKSAAMQGAIERLTRPRSIAAALPTYLVARPLAGLVSTFRPQDPIPHVNQFEECLAGKRPNPDVATAWPERPVSVPGIFARNSHIATRALCYLAPLGLAALTRGALNATSGPGFASSYLTDVILLLAWGPAIAHIESITGSHEAFTDENKFRAGREVIANSRQAPAAAAVAPDDHQV